MKIELTIQEIFNDLFFLAQEEGYLSGLADCECISEEKEIEYHCYMRDLIEKYIPKWNDIVDKKYFSDIDDHEKGLMLSKILTENFKEIIYQLV